MDVFDAIWINILISIFAYFLGSWNFSLFITETLKYKKSIRESGSGNAGATNALRSYGIKFGLLIFIVDVSKSFWFAFILGSMQRFIPELTLNNGFPLIYPQICAFFIVVGHIWPVFYNFKGGKGAACMLGLISAISLIAAATGTIIFLLVVTITRYVSLGSMIVPPIISPIVFFSNYWNFYDTIIYSQKESLFTLVSFISIILTSILVTYLHKENIVRLINKKENKLNYSKNKNS